MSLQDLRTALPTYTQDLAFPKQEQADALCQILEHSMDKLINSVEHMSLAELQKHQQLFETITQKLCVLLNATHMPAAQMMTQSILKEADQLITPHICAHHQILGQYSIFKSPSSASSDPTIRNTGPARHTP